MTSDDERPARGQTPTRGHVRFSATLARQVCLRVAAGESLASICSESGLPSEQSLRRWARRHPGFGRIFERAKALAPRKPVSGQGYCPAAANEIVARVSQGEMLTEIAADPLMPSLRTMYRWKAEHPEFAEDMRLAREALAERFSDLGWKIAMAATPETAFLTQVRLKQLRWTAAVLGPRTHARLKAYAPPEPPDVTTILFRHFKIEEHPETGQHRVVAYTPDPETLQPVRTSEGEWKTPVDPVAKMDAVMALSRQRLETWADDDE
jgi:hypothetical protein